MFDIESIELVNFKSFKGSHTIKIPAEAGLYSLTGRNEANPRLETNGCGKTTLLDAIRWCWYGASARGLKAGDVITWGQRQCAVTVHGTIGSHKLITKRTQSPNSLTVTENGVTKIVDQAGLQKYLRLNADSFDRSVILPQFGTSFFELLPAAKLALFSQILELEYWLERSTAASKLTGELHDFIEKLSRTRAKHVGQLDTIKADIAALREKQADFISGQEQVIKALEFGLKDYIATVKKLDTKIKDVKSALLTAEQRLVAQAKAVKPHTLKLTQLEHERQTLKDTLIKCQSRLEHDENELKSISGLGAECPTCKQSVPQLHMRSQRDKTKARIAGNHKGIAELEDRIHEIEADKKLIITGLEKAAEITTAVNRNKADFERELAALQHQQGSGKSRQAELQANIAAEMQRVNPYTQMIGEKKADITKVKALLEELNKELTELGEEHAAVSYWVQGFKRVRLFIVEETLRQLEVEVNNNLSSLGLTDWQVAFDVERENKSSGVTKGFVCFVRSPEHSEPARMEAWSGGETQRLQLAGDLGLANLIMERAGLISNIEFFDEPSKHMSRQGLLDLAETLYDRAHRLGKRIFLVDHATLDFGGFGKTLVAVKTDTGSRVEFG